MAAIEARGIARHFGSVRALVDVNFSVAAGEVVSLVGDNGAGKSTLMNILCGADSPNAGAVIVGDTELAGLRHAQDLGVGMVYQDLALAPHLSVTENMFLGRELLQPGIRGWLRWQDRAAMGAVARKAVDDLGISTLRKVSAKVRQLSGGQRQVAAVARALMWSRSVILLDEPTAALGPHQVGMVLQAIRAAADRGVAVIMISHDIPHVIETSDRILALRRGEIVAELDPAATSVTEVVSAMVGGAEESTNREGEVTA